MKLYISKLSPFLRNTLKLSSSSFAVLLIPFFVAPILSRLYSPEDYGVWGVFSSVLYIINSFIFLSYENTIVKTNENSEIPNLIVLCFIISSFIIFLTISFFSLGRFLSISFFINFKTIPLLAAALIVTSFYNILLIIANREKKYGFMSISTLVNGTAQATCRVFLGWASIFSLGLLVGNIFGQFVALLSIGISLISTLKTYKMQEIKYDTIKKLAIHYKKFPLFDAPAKLIEFSIINLVIIILANYFKNEEIGYFSMVIQFILLPIGILGSALGNVYYKDLSENQFDKSVISSITKKVAKISFIVSLLPLLFLSIGGDKFLVFILGEKWIPAGSMALILAIYSVPVILSQPLLPIFRTLDKQEIKFKLNLINFLFSIGVLMVSASFSENINLVLFNYSISYAIVRFWIFYKILNLTDLTFSSISKYFYVIIGFFYILLLIRIWYSKILFI